MTTITMPTAPVPPAPVPPAPVPLAPVRIAPGSVRGVTLATTFKAEWTKLRTLRSTWITLGAASFISVAMGVLISIATVSRLDRMTPKELLQFDPTSTALIGVMFATVIIGSLAIRSLTAEYSSGMIRSTFAALPHRRTVMAAKATILALIAFPVALASNVVAFLIAQQIFAGKNVQVSFSQPGVVRAVVFGAIAVSLITVLGVGFGGIIKRTAGATTALSLIIIGGGIFGSLLPSSIAQFLPSAALQSMVTVNHAAASGLNPVVALAVLAAFSLGVFEVASMLVARRDA
jgi:ABC-2 type transport system permease protein